MENYQQLCYIPEITLCPIKHNEENKRCLRNYFVSEAFSVQCWGDLLLKQAHLYLQEMT